MEDPQEFLTMREAADICRFKGVWAIRAAIDRGELAAIKINSRHMLIRQSSFMRWLADRKVRSLAAKQ